MPTNKKDNNIPPKEATESAVGCGVSVTVLDVGIEDKQGVKTVVFNSTKRDMPKTREGVLSSEIEEGMIIPAENNVKGQEIGE